MLKKVSAVLFVIKLLWACAAAYGLDYNFGYDTPPPAQPVAYAPPKAAPALNYGNGVTGRWTTLDGRWAKIGPSNEFIAWENPPPVSAAYQSGPPVSSVGPATQSYYQPPVSYAPQYVSLPAQSYYGNCSTGNCAGGVCYAPSAGYSLSYGATCANGRCR